MHNPAPVLENDTHKFLWDFDIQKDHLISARRSDIIIINNKKRRTCKIMDFTVPADHRIKLKANQKKDKYFDLARELKKTKEHEDVNYTNCANYFWYCNQRIIKETGGLGNKGTSGNNPNYYIIGNSQNTEKSPEDLRKFAVTQTPVKNHHLKLI